MSDIATLTPAVPKPDHIPAAAVYDFDLFADPALLEDAHARVLDLATNAPPVFWTPRNGGHWMLCSHRAVFQASRDPERFTSEAIPFETIQQMRAALPEGAPHIVLPVPINLDPPLHGIYRGPIQSVFSPKAMNALKGDIRALAVDLIEGIKADGACEFQSAVAEPLPVTVFLRLFGLPVERQREYRDLVQEHMAAIGKLTAKPEEMQARTRRLIDIMHDTIIDRRDNPQDDVISMLWRSEFDGKPATLNDLEDFSSLLFLAGLDTVMNGMGLGVHHLATHPELQADLRANPKKIVEATEELLRRYTFTVPPRWVAKDQEFEGVTMKQGERALLFLPAADLDAREFAHPDSFDLERENKVHIAFGTGAHRCLGSHLARIELQILYEELLARLPEFRLDPDKPVTYHGGHVLGPEALHLVWGD